MADTPYPKRTRHLPVILSKQEVARLIDAAGTPLHRILLMTLYATRARNAELTHLKGSDIARQRLGGHIQSGERPADRGVMLSPKPLVALPAQWPGLLTAT